LGPEQAVWRAAASPRLRLPAPCGATLRRDFAARPPFARRAGSLPGTPVLPPPPCHYCATLRPAESRTQDARTRTAEGRRPAVECPFPDCSCRSLAPVPYTIPWLVTEANPLDNTEPPRRDRRGLPSHDVPPGLPEDRLQVCAAESDDPSPAN